MINIVYFWPFFTLDIMHYFFFFYFFLSYGTLESLQEAQIVLQFAIHSIDEFFRVQVGVSSCFGSMDH
jgi:hypothetical protein